MDEIILEGFDLENLVRNLNNQIVTPGEVLAMGEYQSRSRLRKGIVNNINHLSDGRKSRSYGTIDLLLPSEADKNDYEVTGKKVGYIEVETGWLDRKNEYQGDYEVVNIHFSKEFALKHNYSIPKASIEVKLRYAPCMDTLIDREDKSGGMISKKINLTEEIPTDWFLKGYARDHLKSELNQR